MAFARMGREFQSFGMGGGPWHGSWLIDRGPQGVSPFRLVPVLVPHVWVSEEILEDKPSVGRPPVDPAGSDYLRLAMSQRAVCVPPDYRNSIRYSR